MNNIQIDNSIKQIKLFPLPPLYNYMEISVIDFPKPDTERERCKVTCEFARFDVEQLKQQGLEFKEAISHYEKWLYDTIKVHIASDWECVDGYDEVMSLISQNVKRFY